MTNLTNAKVIWCKGILFVFLGLLASGLLIVRTPEITTVLLLGITVWAFCRAYYFAFYVIEHYVDPSYRFAGLGASITSRAGASLLAKSLGSI